MNQTVTNVEGKFMMLGSPCLKFRYAGHMREVDSVAYEPTTGCIVGFEMRKDGKFSYATKRYLVNKIESDVVSIARPHRSGPMIGRPYGSS